MPDLSLIALAKSLYLQHRGQHHRLIESLIRQGGYPKFSRRVFYNRGKTIGWIKRFGWNRDSETRRHGDAANESVPGAVAAGAFFTASPRRPVTVSDKFHAWLKRVSPNMTWDWRHQLHLYDKLQDVTEGRTKRLMIFMPPRHGKSELVTVRYTAWRLSRDPSLNVILGSYNQRLANRFSRRIRSVWEDANRSEPPALAGGRDSAVVKTAENSGPKANDRSRGDIGSSPGAAPPAYAGGSDSRCTRLNTAAEWETFPNGGGVKAVGVGAGITGFGAGLVIIDDPVKSRAQAESETYRDRVWEWFNDDIYTRLEPDAAVILIQTRWHEDDLAGRLLREQHDGGDRWEIVSLPALAEAPPPGTPAPSPITQAPSPGTQACRLHECEALTPRTDNADVNAGRRVHAGEGACAPGKGADETRDVLGRLPGEALCPERFDLEALLQRKRKLGSYSFSALYQQNPVPLDGGLFKRSWFKRVVARAPENLRWARGYDLAVSLSNSADYTASFRCAFDQDGNLYIADGFRKRMEYPEQRRWIVKRMQTERNTQHGIELAMHGKAFVQDLRLDRGLSGIPLRGVRVDADKFTRALAWANLAEEGKVTLVRGPWIDEFLDEATQFPTARHDDQIDAVSIAVKMLAKGRKAYGF
jgi:predicted phage terminase large subunit-like protein